MTFVPGPEVTPEDAWIQVVESMMARFDTEDRDVWKPALDSGTTIFTAFMVARERNEHATHPVMMLPCFPDLPPLALQVFGSFRILTAIGVVLARQRAAGNENMLPQAEGYFISAMGVLIRQRNTVTYRPSDSFLVSDIGGTYFARRYMGTDSPLVTHICVPEETPEDEVEYVLNNDSRLDPEHMALGNILWSVHAEPEECRDMFGEATDEASLDALIDTLFEADDDPYHPLSRLRQN